MNRDLEITVSVAAGAALGAMLRWAAAAAAGAPTDVLPWPTLLVNAIGSLAMGLVLGRLAHLGESRARIVPFATTGFLGGLTTFSSFAMETVVLVEAGQAPLALTYVVSTLLIGLVAVRAGFQIADRSARL